MTASKVFAIILNYNSAKDTCELYDQLNKYYPKLNIIVVDNKANIIDRQSLVNYIPNDQLILNDDNLGYAGGNNIGTEKAMGLGAEFIWILNPDIRINKYTLPLLLETIQADSKIAAVGPRICYRNDNELIYSDGGLLNPTTLATKHRNSRERTSEIINQLELFDADYIDGSSVLMSVEALKSFGLMSEEFFLYFEETEWCHRLKKNGWKLIVNIKAKAFQNDSPKGVNYNYYMTRNKLILAKIININFNEILLNSIKSLVFKTSINIIKGKFDYSLFKVNCKGVYDGYLYSRKF